MAWILLPVFRQVYAENQDLKPYSKSFPFPQDGRLGKAGVEESLIVEKIIIKKKLNVL